MSDANQITLVQALEGHQDRVWHCAWSPNGNILATCSGDKTLFFAENFHFGITIFNRFCCDQYTRIWTLRNGKWEVAQALKDHERTVRRVAFSPDGNLLATSSFDSTTSVYELRDGKFHLLQTLEGHENEVKGVSWDCSGTLLATCSRDKSVWFFILESDLQLDCISVGQSHTQDVKSVLWHPTREMLLSCSYDDTMKIWQGNDDDDWVCTETLKGHKSTVWDATFEPNDGNFLVSCSEDKSIILWKLTNPENMPAPGDEVTRFVKVFEDAASHSRTVYSVDWSKSNLLVTGSADDAVRVFSLVDLAGKAPSIKLQQSVPKAHSSDINCVKWHPSQPIFASCGDDGLVRLWRFEAPQ